MPEYHRTQRLILPEPNGAGALQLILDRANAKLSKEEQFRGHFGVTRDTFWQLAPELWVNQIDDSLANACAYVLIGTHLPRVVSLADVFKRALHPVPYEDLLHATCTPDEEVRATAVSRVGLGAPYDFDQRAFACITGAFTDNRVKVRNAAIRATAYSPWSEFRAALLSHVEVESDPELRELARWMTTVRVDQFGQLLEAPE